MMFRILGTIIFVPLSIFLTWKCWVEWTGRSALRDGAAIYAEYIRSLPGEALGPSPSIIAPHELYASKAASELYGRDINGIFKSHPELFCDYAFGRLTIKGRRAFFGIWTGEDGKFDDKTFSLLFDAEKNMDDESLLHGLLLCRDNTKDLIKFWIEKNEGAEYEIGEIDPVDYFDIGD